MLFLFESAGQLQCCHYRARPTSNVWLNCVIGFVLEKQLVSTTTVDEQCSAAVGGHDKTDKTVHVGVHGTLSYGGIVGQLKINVKFWKWHVETDLEAPAWNGSNSFWYKSIFSPEHRSRLLLKLWAKLLRGGLIVTEQCPKEGAERERFVCWLLFYWLLISHNTGHGGKRYQSYCSSSDTGRQVKAKVSPTLTQSNQCMHSSCIYEEIAWLCWKIKVSKRLPVS